MKFLLKRKQCKLIAELKTRRHAEDDLLSPALRHDFDLIISDLERSEATPAAMKSARDRFASLHLPVKRGAMFAFLDLVAVVGAVAFGLRGLYFQPFRIPTSSMQPTLYGIHYLSKENASNRFLEKIPSPLNKLLFAMTDASVKSPENATYFSGNERLVSGAVFDRTEFPLGRSLISLPGNPDQVIAYAKLADGRSFSKGETISDGFVSLGDHLFVERFSLYLSPPKRGDVMVFTTENLKYNDIPLMLTGGYYYIKRLAALPGDTVKIVDDQLYVKPSGKGDFRRIQDVEPRFKKIYSMKGGYHGHLSRMGNQGFAYGEEFTIPEDTYLMLGDNSRFSMDSRYFGTVHRRQLIGRAWLTFYPLSRRTGIVDRCEALDVPTGEASHSTFPVMYRQ